MNKFTSKFEDLLDEVLIIHFSIRVCLQNFDKVSFVFHHEIKVSLFVHKHRYTNWLATDANISLNFFIITFFMREEDRVLLCGCDTIENNSIIVLTAKCYIKTTMRLNLHNNCSMHNIITNTTVHASLEFSYVMSIFHWVWIWIHFNNIKKNISFFAIFFTTMTFYTG